MNTQHDTKRFPGFVKAISLDESGNGTLEGYANVFNVKDSYNEVTVPGAFAQDIQEFIRTGYLLVDHEWEVTSAIGMILEAREDATGLWFKAAFHSSDKAQAMRGMIAERLSEGKEVGLSIGYWVLEDESGDFNGEQVRFLKRLVVKEVSPVVAQANAPSTVTAAKAHREDAHAVLVADADAYLERIKAINDLGRSDTWKQERVDELLTLAQKFSEAAGCLAPEPETEPETDDDGDYLAALALIELDLIPN